MNLSKFLSEAAGLGITFDWVLADANHYDLQLTDGRRSRRRHVRRHRTSTRSSTPEEAAENPASQQYLELIDRYDPGGKIANLGIQGLSSWLVFAKAANECGAELTRDCVWENTQSITEWTGGGLHARQNLAEFAASNCYALARQSKVARSCSTTPSSRPTASSTATTATLRRSPATTEPAPSARTRRTRPTRSRRPAREFDHEGPAARPGPQGGLNRVTDFLSFTIAGLSVAAILAVAASGLVLTYTTTGVFNFAHGAIGMLGAFTYWQLRFDWGWPTPIAIAVVLLVLGPLFGAFLEVVDLPRPAADDRDRQARRVGLAALLDDRHRELDLGSERVPSRREVLRLEELLDRRRPRSPVTS